MICLVEELCYVFWKVPCFVLWTFHIKFGRGAGLNLVEGPCYVWRRWHVLSGGGTRWREWLVSCCCAVAHFLLCKDLRP